MKYSRGFVPTMASLLGLPCLLLFFLFIIDSPKNVSAVLPDEGDTPSETVQNARTSEESLFISRRLIVELASPSLAVFQEEAVRAAGPTAKLDVTAASAQTHLVQINAEQSVFASALERALPGAEITQILDESGAERNASYNIIFNGLAVDIGEMSHENAMARLSQLDGVKRVYLDKPYLPDLYSSVLTTRAPDVWNLPSIGGFENAGRGIRIASIDSGLHGKAPMFDGTGYSYPAGWPEGGLGDTENNNGKLIVSRAYFRANDPPLPGEDRGWPGGLGSSHGTHTASTAGGRLITTTVPGLGEQTLSGVAPSAYLMSYKVSYGSELDMPFFFTAELLMAMEDAVRDGADIVNNSWGGGPDSIGGEFDAVDNGLINLAKAGVFVSMSTGNSGPGTGTSDHPSPNYINVAAGAGQLTNGILNGLVTDFSSRGPGVGNVLKPDITAPGERVYAQGYESCFGCGEDIHLGFGAVSGTSMAAPHVSGAVALLKQLHPEWSNAMLKSALMSTAQYTNIGREEDGAPAQPLDMGAGWIDVAAAVDPGVILDPPSLGFGLVATGTQQSRVVQLTNITNATETYTVTTFYNASNDQAPTAIPGFTAEPPTMTLAAGATAVVTITFDAVTGLGYGDNQGYVVLTGDAHEAHFAVWARVSYDAPLADILILDNDGSEENGTLFPDVVPAYTTVLNELGYTYNVHSILHRGADATTVPDAAELSAYKAIIIVTGENGRANLPAVLIQAFTEPEMDRVVEYLNNGGAVLGMGANMGRVMLSDATDDLRAPFLYRDIFRSNWIQDSVTSDLPPQSPVVALRTGPPALADLIMEITTDSMDEIDFQYHNGWPLTYGGTPLLQYTGQGSRYFGIVGMMTRDQPSLARPGITYAGRSIYTTFGLEDVDDDAEPVVSLQPADRTEVLDRFLNLVWSEPATMAISVTAPVTTGQSSLIMLDVSGGLNQMGVADNNALQIDNMLWDFGDGSEIVETTSLAPRRHSYYFCDEYTVRAVTLDRNGNIAVTSRNVTVADFCVEPQKVFMPLLQN